MSHHDAPTEFASRKPAPAARGRAPAPTGAAGSSSLSSVRNAARVLKAFSACQRSFGVTELARELDLSTSTAHRLLTSLAAEDLIGQDPATGRYQLGPAVHDLVAAIGD